MPEVIRRKINPLAAALWLNAVAMLGLTFATALYDSTQVIAWVLTGLVTVLFGVRARFATSAVIGLTDSLGIVLTTWSLQTMMLAGAAGIYAYLLRQSWLGVVVSSCAIAFAALSLIGRNRNIAARLRALAYSATAGLALDMSSAQLAGR